MNKAYLKQLLEEKLKKHKEKLENRKEAKRKLATAVIDKWMRIEEAILGSTIDCDEMERDALSFHLNNVAEQLFLLREVKYNREHFEKAEVQITLLEGLLDDLESSKAISFKLWELINISIGSFNQFLSYQMINNEK
jgi:hypothetical protein